MAILDSEHSGRDVRPDDAERVVYLESRVEALANRLREVESELMALRLELARDRE